jgi:hypothetical protein
MGLRGIEQGMRFRANLPKQLICKVFFDIVREAAQGLLDPVSSCIQ